jgi:PPM family protein phosphatase
MGLILRSLPISLSWDKINSQFSLAEQSQFLICQDNKVLFIRDGKRVQEYIQGIGALYCISNGIKALPMPKASASIAIRVAREFYQSATPNSPIMQLTRFVDQSHYRIKEKAERDNIAPLGASIITAWVLDDKLHFINIGNTRLYKINFDGIELCTTDQSIEHFKDEKHSSSSRLAQAFFYGRHDNKEQLHIELGINVKSLKLQKGDRFILCNSSLPLALSDDFSHFIRSPIEKINYELKSWLKRLTFQDEISAVILDVQ